MSIRRLRVNLEGESTYEVRIGQGALDGFAAYLRTMNTSAVALIISDTNVTSLYGATVRENLEEQGYEVFDLAIPAGEKSKNSDVLVEIWEAMALMKLARGDLVIALGGGVVSDIAGLAASTYQRGLAFVAIPTSLLAMVDASVGGKNAINLAAGKNLVGTFAQPLHVLVETAVLATLPQREWTSGLAEVAKCAIVGPSELFEEVCDNAHLLAAHDLEAIGAAIMGCLAFKASVVAKDEHDTRGVRECLNYGHTLAHALESLDGYATLSHGQAVAFGMRFAAHLGAALEVTSAELADDQGILLDLLGLGLSMNGFADWIISLSPEKVVSEMHHDKKIQDGTIRFVLPKTQGAWETVGLDDVVIAEQFACWQQTLSSSVGED